MDEVRHIKDAQGLVPSIVFQPIPMDMTKHFAKNGGNPLGLENQEPLNREQLLFWPVPHSVFR